MPRWQIRTGSASRWIVRYFSQPLGKIWRKRKAQVSAALLDAEDARAFHHRLQSAPDGFDLG
jgi:hypothetical protein